MRTEFSHDMALGWGKVKVEEMDQAAAMFWDGTGLADGVCDQFRIGKRNAWKRDGRRLTARGNATGAGAVVGAKRRVWAAHRSQEMEGGQRKKQHRGSGSELRRKERRAQMRGAALEHACGARSRSDSGCSEGQGAGSGWVCSSESSVPGEDCGGTSGGAAAFVAERWAGRVAIRALYRRVEQNVRAALKGWKAGVWKLGRRAARLIGGDGSGWLYEQIQGGGEQGEWCDRIMEVGFWRSEAAGWSKMAEEMQALYDVRRAEMYAAVKVDLKAEVEFVDRLQVQGKQASQERWDRFREEKEEWKNEQKVIRGQLELARAEGKGRTKGGVVLGELPRLGPEQQGMLDRVATEDEGMRRLEGRSLGSGLQGAVLYNYRSGDKLQVVADRNSSSEEGRREMFKLLAECRGLVLCDGQVVCRPVQRFHRVGEMGGLAGVVTAQVVTEKLDGQMVCGVVWDGAVELWTRSGWTEQAQAATWVAQECEGMLRLISVVWAQGGSPTFEYVGKQSLVKVRYRDTRLVLVAVRDRETGRWWEYERLEQLCAEHGVQLVRRCRELEGRTLREIRAQVENWQGVEGVVVWLDDRQVCKVKSNWWMDRVSQQRRRWCREGAGKVAAESRFEKKKQYMECRQQRVVLRGWAGNVSPAQALQVFPTVDKVEAIYRRADGKQGTVVLGFRDREAATAVRGRQVVEGRAVWAEQAYSGRCRSDQHKLVRTWWRQPEHSVSEGGCEGDSVSSDREGWDEEMYELEKEWAEQVQQG